MKYSLWRVTLCAVTRTIYTALSKTARELLPAFHRRGHRWGEVGALSRSGFTTATMKARCLAHRWGEE